MEIRQPHTRNVLRTGCAALENAEESLRCRTFAEHELAETWSAEAEKHAQAKGAMLLQEWMQPSEEELIC